MSAKLALRPSQTSNKRRREEPDNTAEQSVELFDAISEGNNKSVTQILKSARNLPALLMKKDPQGLVPLKKATALNKAEIARILVVNGASPAVRDPIGKTPLHIAVMQGRRELMAPLLVSVDSCVNVQDNAGWTPLHYAVRGKHLKVLEWLLYAGADVNLRNKDDESPIDWTEDDSLMRKMLKASNVDRDLYPVTLSSAFISRKDLNYIGTDGLVMFVTSEKWSPYHQFFFCKRIRPTEARPLIPLRWNECCYGDVYHYRTMRRLNQGETRVKIYLIFFEEIKYSELVLKVTSKDKFLGEIPLLRSTYIQDTYTNFMGSCEFDIKAEGQFVMVKRNVALQLRKTEDGGLTTPKYPNFLIDLKEGSLPSAPKEWDKTREERALKDRSKLVRATEKILAAMSTMDFGYLEEFYTLTCDDEATPPASIAPAPEVVAEGSQSQVLRSDIQSSRASVAAPESQQPPDDEPNVSDIESEATLEAMLEAFQEDTCEDFYYISKGWGLYLTVMQAFNISVLTDMFGKEKEKTIQIRCSSAFYYLNHSSDQHSRYECVLQIPKTEEFEKVGTVLVFVRKTVAPEDESPDPDDSSQEYMLSDDMKNSWGIYWMNQERDRWSLISEGITNRTSRVVFKTKTMSAFIVVQLTTGRDRCEKEEDESESEDEEGDDSVPEDGDGDEKEEKTIAETAEDGRHGSQGEDDSAPKKKRMKSRGSTASRLSRLREDFCILDEADLEEEHNLFGQAGEGEEGEDATGAEVTDAVAEQGPEVTTAEEVAAEPGAPAPSPMVNKDEGNKDENASNLRYFNGRGNISNNNTNSIIDAETAEMNKNNNEIRDNDEDYDQSGLASEEKTIVVNLPPELLSFHKLVTAPSIFVSGNKGEPEDQDVTETSATLREDGSNERNKHPSNAESAHATMPHLPSMPSEMPPNASLQFLEEDAESDEDLPEIGSKRLSLFVIKNGVKKAQEFQYGPKLDSMPLPGVDIEQVKTEIAQMWRYRNHRKTCILIFSRHREDHAFDMIIDVVQSCDIYVRAESLYSVGFRMVGESQPLPIKTGRLLSFTIEGPLIVEKCEGGITSFHGNPRTKTMYFSHSMINTLNFTVRRPQVEEVKGPANKKGKKKEEVKVELEPDARLESMAFNAGSGTNGVDLPALTIWLTGPDLWAERHVKLRASDDQLLDMLIHCLIKSRALARNWWRLLLLLGYPEKVVEEEKGKTMPVVVVQTYLRKWFEDCLTLHDRGILRLIQVLDTLKLDIAIDNVVRIMKLYKAHLLKETSRPRYLKLLFHWVLQTKVTRNNLLRLPDPQILRPVSDQFLLYLSDFLPAKDLFKIGGAMDVEENVLHAISQEEVIADEAYVGFRVLVKSRQKKDEIIHYTLLLMEMFKQVELPDANDFMVRETKKWMETVSDNEHEVCSKLENVFG